MKNVTNEVFYWTTPEIRSRFISSHFSFNFSPCFPSLIRFWSSCVRSISSSCSLSFFSFSSSVLSRQKQICESDPPLTISYIRKIKHHFWRLLLSSFLSITNIYIYTSPSLAREIAQILSSCFSNAVTTSPVLNAHILWWWNEKWKHIEHSCSSLKSITNRLEIHTSSHRPLHCWLTAFHEKGKKDEGEKKNGQIENEED